MEWRHVQGYEGTYEVSEDGDIRRVAGSVLRPWKSGQGHYLAVSLSQDGVITKCYVHQIVAGAFIGQMKVGRRKTDMQVNHRDGDRQHNHVDNLEYVTVQENHKHAARIGLAAKGERHGMAKLSPDDIVAIRRSSWTMPILSARYGVHVQTVYGIRSRKLWKHVA